MRHSITPIQQPQTDWQARADAAARVPNPMYAARAGNISTPMQQPQPDWQNVADAAAIVPNSSYVSRADRAYKGGACVCGRGSLCSLIRSHRSCIAAGIAILLSLVAVGLTPLTFINKEEISELSTTVDALKRYQDDIGQLFATVDTLKRDLDKERNRTAALEQRLRDLSKSPGYSMSRGVCYMVYSIRHTFNDAAATCREDGGTLAMPRDPHTNDFLISLYKSVSDNEEFWFGLHDRRKEGSFEWVDGSALGTYNLWTPGEPNNFFGNEDCIYYSEKDMWNDLSCNNRIGFICQAVPGTSSKRASTAKNIAVRGHPFHLLSAKTMAPLEHSVVNILALVEAEITDIESNTFVAFSNLNRLSLDSNRLTEVKQAWFTGLENLLMLILSNNQIKHIESRGFVHLTVLHILDLERNRLMVVNPAWFLGMRSTKIINMAFNPIHSISAGSFQDLQLRWLDLEGTDLSCMDGGVFQGQSSSSNLHVSSDMLSSVRDTKPYNLMWSLDRSTNIIEGLAKLVVGVPKFLFCARQSKVSQKISFGWSFDSSVNEPRKIDLAAFNPGKSCSDLNPSLFTISIQAPVVVLATDCSLADILVLNTLEWCRHAWEYDKGVAVGLLETLMFRLAYIAKGNATLKGVAMSFVQTHDTNTFTTATESEFSQNHTTHSHATRDNTKNITCILITKDHHSEFFFDVSPVQDQTEAPATTYGIDSTRLIHLDNTSSQPGDMSTPQVSTTLGQDAPQENSHVLISVVSAVVGLVPLSIVVLIWKLRQARLKVEAGRANGDSHILTPGVALPGLLRSASLPAFPCKVASVDEASFRSLPATQYAIEIAYSEIPDEIAAQYHLPTLPHTYWEIPDHIAAAQRPLPTLPPTSCEIPDHGAAAQRPLPASGHTYSTIPDDGVRGNLPCYTDAADFSFRAVTSWEKAYRDNTTAHSKRRSRSSVPTYGSVKQTKSQCNSFYIKVPEVQGFKARKQQRTAMICQAVNQSVRNYVNVTNGILSKWPNTPKRASLPLVKLPITYWPWEIPGEKTCNAQRHGSFSLVQLPNTYWPWEIPGQGTRDTPRRSSLPLVTLPNTYWPWEVPGQGTRDTPRRSSLPLVTLPNTYWPWEIPGQGTRDTPRRSSLPLVTLPNTYWPWEIPGQGTRDTPRRSSLPLVTLPNTYWPWEVPGQGTRDTPRRSSLPLVTLPNTYWPWEIPGQGTRDTPRRSSLPLVTLPNTYWPWEIPGQGTRDTPQRSSLPLVTLPNTYWPWAIPGQGTRDTPRRSSLPLVTLPNTYWPWEIPGQGTLDTPRRSSLSLVTLPNTYWPWELIAGHGN
uniref:C-type lectin domain-containing protein n=1 Tax=Branchiostoma floridae TaxID=7739 RepID=C3ZPK8_BRAFL|eukprot:XP_002589494.1 hypothetical protein BRAFLDRAFT_88353 [Branchiostoma floridae]